MVGKKSGKALLREEGKSFSNSLASNWSEYRLEKCHIADRKPGLERTDNNMDTTMWPQVNMINQKNYYT